VPEARTVANIAIILAAAGVVTALLWFAGEAVSLFLLILQIAILVAIVYFLYTVYRNNRSRLAWLDPGKRALFYGAAVLLVAVVVASFAMPFFGGWSFFTAVLFFGVIAVCAFVMYRIWTETSGWY
jgi:hypothetical protein